MVFLGHGYRICNRGRFQAHVGSQEVEHIADGRTDGTTASEDTDLGFVPLLNLGATYRASEHWRLLFDFDGLAGGPGRAFDISLKVGYDFNRRVGLTAGYRLVEGGADVEQVYNFAWINYLVASVVLGF